MSKKITFILMLILTGFLFTGLAYGKDYTAKYEVTITNLTAGQIFSPPAVITHKYDFSLFEPGEMAGEELAALAEDGMTDPLADLVSNYPGTTFQVAEGPVFPGTSITVEVEVKPGARFISMAGMLVTTNDAFFAVNGMKIPLRRESVVDVQAYDAGSEFNSEDCAYIPGPPCGNGGVRDTDGAEGYVHIHSGIHGSGPTPELVDPSLHDWRNPVALVKIRRIN